MLRQYFPLTVNRPKELFSSETAIFSRNKPVSAENAICPTKSEAHIVIRISSRFNWLSGSPYFNAKCGRNRLISAENGCYGQKQPFRPKIIVTAVITVSAEFRHFIPNCFGIGVSAKILFRSHTNTREIEYVQRAEELLCHLVNRLLIKLYVRTYD